MEQQQPGAVMEGRPHAAEFFRPIDLFLGVCVACATATLFFKGAPDAWRMTVTGIVVLIPIGLWLALALKRRAVCRWRWDNGVFFFVRGALARRELAFRTDRLLYAETLRSPLLSLLGGVRVKLYAGAADRVVFSAILPRQQADALPERLMCSQESGDAPQNRSIASGRYAALPSAMTDGIVLTLLGSAAIFALVGAGRFFMNVTAVVLWLGALVRLVGRLISEGRLSVNRTHGGWVIVKGIGGGRRLYIPDKSVIGIRESSTLPALLCGARRVELLCGGRRIPCMRWYISSHSSAASDENASSLACGLLGCDGNAFVALKNPRAVRQRYFLMGVILLCGAALAGFVNLSSTRNDGEIGAITAALGICGVTGGLLQCAAGVSIGRTWGISVSPSSVRAAGMGLLTSEVWTLRRGCLAEVRVGRTPVDRVNGFCTVELIPKGCRSGVNCRCMPYDRVQALLERFG